VTTVTEPGRDFYQALANRSRRYRRERATQGGDSQQARTTIAGSGELQQQNEALLSLLELKGTSIDRVPRRRDRNAGVELRRTSRCHAVSNDGVEIDMPWWRARSTP